MTENTKACTKCKLLLPFSQYSKGGDRFGLQKICKGCTSAYMKARHAVRREELCEKSRLYRLNNMDKIKEQQKEFTVKKCGQGGS